MKKFALRLKKTGNLLEFYTRSNEGGDFCGDTQTMLSEGDKEVQAGKTWLVETALNAAYVKRFSTEWYNAGYDTPTHSFKEEDLEVVAVEITICVEPADLSVPTFMDFCEGKYAKSDPAHLAYIKSEAIKWPHQYEKAHYLIYDLQEMERKNPEGLKKMIDKASGKL